MEPPDETRATGRRHVWQGLTVSEMSEPWVALWDALGPLAENWQPMIVPSSSLPLLSINTHTTHRGKGHPEQSFHQACPWRAPLSSGSPKRKKPY